jgi:hypothetical protein
LYHKGVGVLNFHLSLQNGSLSMEKRMKIKVLLFKLLLIDENM